MDELKSHGKPFDISKWEVWEAFGKVKENQGAAGVDGVSIAGFEADLKNNLYRIWNRMSSGTWFPPPVRAVEIPKPAWRRHQDARHRDRRGQGRSDRCCPASGGSRGTGVPRRFLRIPARTVCPGGGRAVQAAVPEAGLGC